MLIILEKVKQHLTLFLILIYLNKEMNIHTIIDTNEAKAKDSKHP